MQQVKIVLVLVLTGLLSQSPSWADPNKPYDKAYAEGTGRKLERGVSNTTMGWMEIPREITKQGKQHGVVQAVFLGPIIGAANAVARTASGVYETATFAVPSHPAFQPLVQPEFVLDEKNDGKK